MDNVLKVRFQDSTAPLEQQAEEIHKAISALEGIKSSPDSLESKYQAAALITHYLSLAELYLKINDAHVNLFRKNMEASLDNARKMFSAIITKAEGSFGIRIHSTLGDNQKVMDALTELNPHRIYRLIFRMNRELLKLRSFYPTASAMSLTLGRMYRDISGLALNLINFKSWIPFTKDLRSPFYEDTKKLFVLIISMIEGSADMIMETYHLSKNKNSLDEGIGILEHLENIQRLLHEPGMDETRRKKESWARFL